MHFSHALQKTHRGKETHPSFTQWLVIGERHHAGGNHEANTNVAVTLDFDSKPRDLGTAEEHNFEEDEKTDSRAKETSLEHGFVDAVPNKLIMSATDAEHRPAVRKWTAMLEGSVDPRSSHKSDRAVS